MNEQNIKYFIYARKSQESDERQVQSIDDQIHIAEKIARQYGLEVVDVFRESKSAKKPYNRPVFSEMLQRIKAGEATGIITWKLDRLGRNQLESGMVGQMLEDREIEVIRTPEKEYRPEDNVVIYSIETAMATQYSKDLSKNVKRGQSGKIKRGWYPGRAPMGYLNCPTTKEIIPDQERFDMLRRAWDLMLTGLYSPPEVMDILNEEWGFTTVKRGKTGGGKISKANIYKFFGNVFYTGTHFEWNGILHTNGQHKPMVSMEEFEEVQRIMGKTDRPRTYKHEYAYKGVFHCDCGCSITSYVKKEKYNYYKCTKRKVGIVCDAKQISERKLEKEIIKKIEDLVIHPQFLEWSFKAIEECSKAELKTDQDIVTSRINAVIQKRDQIGKLNEMLSKSYISDEEYLESKERLQKEIAELEAQKDKEINLREKKEELKDVFVFMSQLVQILEGNSGDSKRKALFSIGENHILQNTEPILNLHSFLRPVRTSYESLYSDYYNVRTRENGSVKLREADLEAINLLWCGWGESNSRLILGKDLFYH